MARPVRLAGLGSVMSDDQHLAALLGLSAAAFNGGDGRPMMISVAFAPDGFSPAQQASARAALAAWAGPTGLSVQDVPDPAGADLVFRLGALDGPWTTGTTAYLDDRTEITLSRSIYGGDSLAPGRRGFETLLHEIGHALGLGHPFEGPGAFPATRDDSVMAYDRGLLGIASAPRPLDVAAAITLWGTAADAAAGPLRWWDGSVIHHQGEGLLRGTAWQDAILGGPGDDILEGRGGSDWLAPGAGADRVDGGSGHDTLRLEVLARDLVLDLRPDPSGGWAGTAGPVRFASIEAIDLPDGRLALSAADPVALAARILLGLPPHGTEALGETAFALLRGAVPPVLADLATLDIDALYATLLHRAPEPGALDYWTQRALADGAGATLAAIAASEEAIAANPVTQLWAARPEALGIDRLYQTAFGRRAEAEGLEFWATAAADRLTVAEGLAASAEFAPVAQAGLLAALYDHAFGRAPDTAGLAFWQGALDAGAITGAGVIEALAGSAERAAHWDAIIA
ncbi:uncharacterized protein DUF4214 [Humitalea rosea]|uniref:Uncharacterized protein DUF4214 n=2 Tax=Humitalea rosea TaxID=990373 RepID=A0A2W7J266_9PROT|nr:uncharacterized protein DUF4214 [Humitalea rosea]